MIFFGLDEAEPIFSHFYFCFFDADHRGLELEVHREADPVLEQWSQAIIFLASIATASVSSPPPLATSACRGTTAKIYRSPGSPPLPVLAPDS
jgi:hypothetical protein